MQPCLKIMRCLVVLVFGAAFLTCIGCKDETERDTTPILNTLIGKWHGEDGNTITATFNRSGEMTIHRPLNLFTDQGECTFMATYQIYDFTTSGKYLDETFTHIIGDCGKDGLQANVGKTGREKLDITDNDHIILGPLRLARSN